MPDENDLRAYDGKNKTEKEITKYYWSNKLRKKSEIILHI